MTDSTGFWFVQWGDGSVRLPDEEEAAAMKAAMRRIRSALTRFDNAAQEMAFKGSAHPDNRDWIEWRYGQARETVERVVREELWKGMTR